LPLIAAPAECSTRIGLGGAIALDHAEPFNIARSFAAVDRLTAGRSAWIAATGTGRPADCGHAPVRTVEERQARAAECIAVVRKLWDSGRMRRSCSTSRTAASPIPTGFTASTMPARISPCAGH